MTTLPQPRLSFPYLFCFRWLSIGFRFLYFVSTWFLFLNETYGTNDISWAQVNILQDSSVLISHCDEAEVEVRWDCCPSAFCLIDQCPWRYSLAFLSLLYSSILQFYWQSITVWFFFIFFCIPLLDIYPFYLWVTCPFHQRLSDNCLSSFCGHYLRSSSCRFAFLFSISLVPF